MKEELFLFSCLSCILVAAGLLTRLHPASKSKLINAALERQRRENESLETTSGVAARLLRQDNSTVADLLCFVSSFFQNVFFFWAPAAPIFSTKGKPDQFFLPKKKSGPLSLSGGVADLPSRQVA